MRFPRYLSLALLAIAILGLGFTLDTSAVPPPPPTEKILVVDTLHGVPIKDPYRWLEDQNSPETRAWIDTQNEYFRSIIDKLPGREKLEKRIGELLKTESIGMPTERGGRYFYSRRPADKDLYIIYMREGLDGEEEVLIDPHTLTPDHSESVGLLDISQDGKLLAYYIRKGGADEVTIKLFDVDSRTNLPDSMPESRYWSLNLTPDKSGFYYTKFKLDIGSRVFYHQLGTPLEDDSLIFGEGYPQDMGVAADLSRDGRYLLFEISEGTSGFKSEVYVMDLQNNNKLLTINKDIEANFWGEIIENNLYLRTNWDAPNWRLLKIDLKNPGQENWKEIIPESDSAVFEGFTMTGGYISARFLKNVVSEAKIFDTDGNFVCDIELPALGTLVYLKGRWDSDEIFYSYYSFHIPYTIYRYDVKKNERTIWARKDIPVDTDNIKVEQVWYKSKDGTRVPMFIVRARDMKLDSNRPTLIYGYGGFNNSETPYFSSTAVLMIEHGGIYVCTNLRGGGEFGEKWHRAAMFEKKQNTFDDFYAAAQWLIDNGYTNPNKLAAMGGSNGGLLVGAALTQRPDLYRVIICTYPLLDMLRYQKMLVGSWWVSEYGSADDSAQFAYLYKYSPYQNVKKGVDYPAVLFVSGDADTRVDPSHARKMTALMQAATGSDHPVLLQYDTRAGHSGGKPMSETISDFTDEMQFLFWQLGVLDDKSPH